MGFSNIGVISDTHNSPAALQEALRTFDDYAVDFIIHCGDITDPEFVSHFRGHRVEFVLGNVDEKSQREELLKAIADIGGVCHGHSAVLEWEGNKIFATHGHDKLLLEEAIYSCQYDLVCCGHTHIYENYKYENTQVLNPGALQSRGSYCVVGDRLDIDKFEVQC